jgi:hypothetical protein
MFTENFTNRKAQSFLAYFLKTDSCDLHAVCVPVNPPHQDFNACTSLYETWYICHGTWPTSLSLVCVCVFFLELLVNH